MCSQTERIGLPPTRYAESGGASIAYQVVGDGPIDVVLALGYSTHLDLQWESPLFARFFDRHQLVLAADPVRQARLRAVRPVSEVPTLEQRVDDVRAVMDAAGSERAAMFGVSEGGPMCVLFAAAHPERATRARAPRRDGTHDRGARLPVGGACRGTAGVRRRVPRAIWGRDARGMVELFAPSLAGMPGVAEFTARMERSAASPAMVQKIFEMFLDIDVRAVLPTIHVPTLVLHRHGDRVVNRRAGRELAARIPGARVRRARRHRPSPVGGRRRTRCSGRSRSS